MNEKMWRDTTVKEWEVQGDLFTYEEVHTKNEIRIICLESNEKCIYPIDLIKKLENIVPVNKISIYERDKLYSLAIAFTTKNKDHISIYYDIIKDSKKIKKHVHHFKSTKNVEEIIMDEWDEKSVKIARKLLCAIDEWMENVSNLRMIFLFDDFNEEFIGDSRIKE